MGHNPKTGKLKVVDYYGSNPQECNVVCSDQPSIGFRKVNDGTYEFVGDFYNTGVTQEKFMNTLGTQYNYAKFSNLVADYGKEIVETTTGTDGEIEILVAL